MNNPPVEQVSCEPPSACAVHELMVSWQYMKSPIKPKKSILSMTPYGWQFRWFIWFKEKDRAYVYL